MSTTPESERLLDLCLMTAYAARSAAAVQRAPCYESLLAELRRLAAVEAARDRYASESAQHFIRAREWAARAGAMEAERDQARAAAMAEGELMRAEIDRLTAARDGWQLAPIEPTPEILDALRTGSRKDWPSDDLCRVRWAAAMAVAARQEPK